jgi:protein arginine kinase activator
MKCDICGENDALIHVQQIMNGETRELHLCAECAGSRGLVEAGEGGEHIGLTNILGSIVGSLFAESEGKPGSRSSVCSSCGMSREELEESGKAGCSDCYAAFPAIIRHVLGKEGGADSYRGKIPKRLQAYKAYLVDKAVLKQKLEEAVEGEEYERAASLRDAIARIEEDSQDRLQ